MKVVITGPAGFIGSHLAEALRARGHEVAGSRARLGEPVDLHAFENADVLIHCAHDLRPGMQDLNVRGSRLFFEAAAAPCHRIFISSHSARADAIGDYATSKYRIETFWQQAGGTLVRPGLVIGSAGLFGRQLRAIRSSKVIPLINGGRDLVPAVAIQDLCKAVVRIVETRETGQHNLFNEDMPSMRAIVDTVLRLANHRALVISIPFSAAMAAVSTAERFGLKLPFTSASLATMKLNRQPVHKSNLRELVDAESTLEQAIAAALHPG